MIDDDPDCYNCSDLVARRAFLLSLVAIDHLRSVVGVEHVGIGTDVNGLRGNTAVPTHREFALIPAGLLSRGYAESDVARIVGGNFMRLFREVTESRG